MKIVANISQKKIENLWITYLEKYFSAKVRPPATCPHKKCGQLTREDRPCLIPSGYQYRGFSSFLPALNATKRASAKSTDERRFR